MAAPAALTRDFLNLTPLQVKDLRSAVVRGKQQGGNLHGVE
jgi:hypothetical protein